MGGFFYAPARNTKCCFVPCSINSCDPLPLTVTSCYQQGIIFLMLLLIDYTLKTLHYVMAG